jgi:hypothetical protein
MIPEANDIYFIILAMLVIAFYSMKFILATVGVKLTVYDFLLIILEEIKSIFKN